MISNKQCWMKNRVFTFQESYLEHTNNSNMREISSFEAMEATVNSPRNSQFTELCWQ